MLAKINRLTKDKDFDKTFKKGRSSYDKTTGVKTITNNLEVNRFGVVVGIKVSKKAVERNKIKRQIREVVKLQAEKLKNGHDLVIITLPAILGKTYKEIEDSVNSNLKRLKLYK